MINVKTFSSCGRVIRHRRDVVYGHNVINSAFQMNCSSLPFIPNRIPPVLLDLNRKASHIHIVNTSLAQRSMQLQGNWDKTCFRFWSELLVSLAAEINVKLLMEISNHF